MTVLVPYVVEKNGRDERAMDIYSRLLKDRIVILGSGVNDDIELAIGILTDADGDGVPDVCQSSLPNFIRGDVNADLGLDISDAIFLLGAIFGGGDPVPCLASADVSPDGNVDIGDPINILGVLFSGAPAPSAPYPDCGPGLQGVVECAVTGCP